MGTINILREYRLKKKMQPSELAALLDIALPTLRSIENGTRRITAERAIAIEIALRGAIRREHLRPDLFRKKAA